MYSGTLLRSWWYYSNIQPMLLDTVAEERVTTELGHLEIFEKSLVILIHIKQLLCHAIITIPNNLSLLTLSD